MEQTLKKKIIGTTVFALAIAVSAISLFGVASAASHKAEAQNGHAYGQAYGHGQPETPPPGQVGNDHSNREGTPGHGRGK